MQALLEQETARLKELYQYEVLDTPAEPDFDDLTQLAAQICQTPVALITLVDANRQWFKSMVGMKVTTAPLEAGFCPFVVQKSDVLIIPDTLADAKFATNPVVVSPPNVRFYTGVPLITSKGYVIGTLCVLDFVPRLLTQQQIEVLQTLSRQVMAQLDQRLMASQIARQNAALLEVTKGISTTIGEAFFYSLVQHMTKALGVHCALISELNQNDQQQASTLAFCVDNKIVSNFNYSLDNSPCKDIVQKRQLCCYPQDIQFQFPGNTFLMQLEIESYLAAPLCDSVGRCLGLLAVMDQKPLDDLHNVELFVSIFATRAATELERQQTESALQRLTQQERERALQLEQALEKLQRTHSQLVQNEKMVSLGQLVAGVAHEINNPLNFIYGNLAYASEYANDLLKLVQLYQKYYPHPVSEIQAALTTTDFNFLQEDLPKLISSMIMGADRIRQIVLLLRNFSRLDQGEITAMDIHEGLDNTLLLLQNRLKATPGYLNTGIQVIKEYGNLPNVECNAGQINQVFMNILTNAIDALRSAQESAVEAQPICDPNPCIRIQTAVLDSEYIIVAITDNGPGMTEEVLSKLFEPFFTTKSVGAGTGLGMSISYDIVEKHGGELTCLSAPGQGAKFIIKMPIRQPNLNSSVL
ncbi:ATP-binding protein [Brasilonema sp. UFV-L1]|uniref:GAF domain-containing sensor histidine kinase n=1 Tax=Brasilonema sp. UFV-L1 TaxID=2234130 RepID=UPI00145D5DAC|nr:ATP-binding protein [Brasilonema sp. UFV-L1]NMG07938.1 ATPase [Brasilonema sp. UFV-L1]